MRWITTHPLAAVLPSALGSQELLASEEGVLLGRRLQKAFFQAVRGRLSSEAEALKASREMPFPTVQGVAKGKRFQVAFPTLRLLSPWEVLPESLGFVWWEGERCAFPGGEVNALGLTLLRDTMRTLSTAYPALATPGALITTEVEGLPWTPHLP